MLGLATYEYLFNEYMSKSMNFSNLMLLSELLSSMDLSCYTVEEYGKLLTMCIILKSNWIIQGLEFTTPFADKNVSHMLLENVTTFVENDIDLTKNIIQNLTKLIRNSEVLSVIESFNETLKSIKYVIHNGGDQTWDYYINNLKKSLNKFLVIRDNLEKPLLLKLSEYLVENKSVNSEDDLIRNYKRFKNTLEIKAAPEKDITWLNDKLKKSGVHSALKQANLFHKGVEVIEVKKIQSSFSNIHNYAGLIREGNLILKQYLNLNTSIETIESHEDNVDIDDVQLENDISYNSKSSSSSSSKSYVPPHKKVLHSSPSFPSPTNTIPSQNTRSNRKSNPSPTIPLKQLSVQLEDVSSQLQMNSDLKANNISTANHVIPLKELSIQLEDVTSQMQTNSDTNSNNNLMPLKELSVQLEDMSSEIQISSDNNEDTISQKSSTEFKRYWTNTHSYWIYKGVKNNMSWAKIRDTFFKGTKRTNVDIKDRWRYMKRHPGLLHEMDMIFKKDPLSKSYN